MLIIPDLKCNFYNIFPAQTNYSTVAQQQECIKNNEFMLFYEFKSESDFITQLNVWRSLLIEEKCCLIPCNQSIHFTLLGT